MRHLGRLLACILSTALVMGQFVPNALAAADAHLTTDVSATTPANGGDLPLDSVAGFEPGWGQAVIDPGTSAEEMITYSGIGTSPLRLFGVTRDEPVDHPAGTVVRMLGATEGGGRSGPAARGADDSSPSTAQDAVEESGVAESTPPTAPISTTQVTAPVSETPEVTHSAAPTAGVAWDPPPIACNLIRAITGKDLCSAITVSDPCAINPLLCNVHIPNDPSDELCRVSSFLCQVPPDIPCPDQTVQECFGLPDPNLDPEDLFLDDLINGALDKGDCDVQINEPQKAQNPETGIYFVAAYGSARCPGYDETDATTCIQIKTPEGWKRKNCMDGTGSTFAEASVLAPCAAKTHRYRTKFTWLATTIANTDGPVNDPSAGTRKVPFDGTKITCPP